MNTKYEMGKWYKIGLKEPIIGLNEIRYKEVLGTPNNVNSIISFDIRDMDGREIPGETYLTLNDNIESIELDSNMTLTPIRNRITTITNDKKVKMCWYRITLKTPIVGYDRKEHKMVLGTLVNKNRYEIRDLNLKAIPGELIIFHDNVEEIEWYGIMEMPKLGGRKSKRRRRRSVRTKK